MEILVDCRIFHEEEKNCQTEKVIKILDVKTFFGVRRWLIKNEWNTNPQKSSETISRGPVRRIDFVPAKECKIAPNWLNILNNCASREHCLKEIANKTRYFKSLQLESSSSGDAKQFHGIWREQRNKRTKFIVLNVWLASGNQKCLQELFGMHQTSTVVYIRILWNWVYEF